MKTLIVLALLVAGTASAGEPTTCHVQVCNRIERWSLSIWSHIKDHMGENCLDVVIDKKDAVVGHVLSSDSRWYQGSTINPTKKSVTRVKKVYACP